MLGVLLPSALAGGSHPPPPPDSISQSVQGEVAPTIPSTPPAPTSEPNPLPRPSDIPVVVLEDPLAHIPTVAAIPYLHPDGESARLSIRIEALGEAGTPELADALLDFYTANEPLVDRMLYSQDATEGQRDQIRRDLGIVPTGVLRSVARAGTRIWAVPPGATHAPAGMFRPDGHTDQELETQWRQSRVANPTWAAPITTRKVQARPPAEIPAGDSTNMLGGYPWEGQTAEDLARFQGAGTPEEVAAFTRVFELMNPGHRGGGALKAGAEVNLPDLYFHEGQRYTETTWNDLRFLENQLENKRISGLFIQRQHLIVLLDDTLPDPSPSHGHRRIALHELGHAVEAMAEAQPGWGAEHRSTMEKLHGDALKRHEAGDTAAFVTDYARKNAGEHYAEAFEAYFTGWRNDDVDQHRPSGLNADYEVLMARDPDVANLIAQDLQHLSGP